MKKKKNKSSIKHKKFQHLNITALDDHARNGNTISPPLSELKKNAISFSWHDDRLPEFLWLAILRTNMGQRKYINLCHEVINNAHKNIANYNDIEVTHSGLSVLDDEAFDSFVKPILENKVVKNLLSELLYFDSLPDKKHWSRHFELNGINQINLVPNAVEQCFYGQSQEATDIQWFNIVYKVRANTLSIGTEELGVNAEEIEKEIVEYPDYGDPRKAGGLIRTADLTCANNNVSCCQAFWQECYQITECKRPDIKKPAINDEMIYFEQIFDIYDKLGKHFESNTENTNLDARKDSCFGIILYSLYLATGLTASGISLPYRAEGRIILRIIVESLITLKFLVQKDDANLWKKFRTYGIGMEKLAFLKNPDEDDKPNFISLEDLHKYINEDMWQEYSDIEIKSWAGQNLRQMAQDAGIKDFYDKYYDLSSSYVHGNWGAIRDTVFTNCLNPLHRFHLIPHIPRIDMPSVLPDIVKIINMMLEILNNLYPSFEHRIKHN